MPIKCRWCDQEHGPTCPTVKRLEFFENGNVKAVEFKTALDYAVPFSPVTPAPWPPNHQPIGTTWSTVGGNPDGTPRYVDMRSHGG